MASGTIAGFGGCSATATAAVSFLSGTGNMTLAGMNKFVSTAGGTRVFGPLLFSGLTIEAGTVLALDASGNQLQIMGPALAGLLTGPPLLRLNLVSYSADVLQGVGIHGMLVFNARNANGTVDTFTVVGEGMILPPLK